MLFEKGEKDWNMSINALLVLTGLAKMLRVDDDEDMPKETKDWFRFEEEAKEAELKMW